MNTKEEENRILLVQFLVYLLNQDDLIQKFLHVQENQQLACLIGTDNNPTWSLTYV